MQPFTVESIEETLILFGIDMGVARTAVEKVYTTEDAVRVLAEVIAESQHGAIVDRANTLAEGVDSLAGPCRRGGVGAACSLDDVMAVEVEFAGERRSVACVYRPYEDLFHPVAHAIEKAVHGQIRIYPLRSTYGAEAVTYAVLPKHDWERLLHHLGAPSFNLLFVGLDGELII